LFTTNIREYNSDNINSANNTKRKARKPQQEQQGRWNVLTNKNSKKNGKNKQDWTKRKE
jgi:hypothetical protein